VSDLNQAKKEFIDYALMIAEKGFIGLIVLGLIPFGTFFLGLTFFYLLYGNKSALVGTGGFILSIAIIFYYGMVVGIWAHKRLVVTGKFNKVLKMLWISSFEE